MGNIIFIEWQRRQVVDTCITLQKIYLAPTSSGHPRSVAHKNVIQLLVNENQLWYTDGERSWASG